MDVLEEVTGDALSLEQVQRRVDDWERRIHDLYAAIKSWLPAGWSAIVDKHSVLFEGELMQEVGLAARRLPILELTDDSLREVVIEPRGLWIIGANGRLDLRYSNFKYMIIDTAENFAPPRWQFVSFLNRSDRKPFDDAALRSILRQ